MIPMVLSVSNAIREASELPLTEGCPSHRDMAWERWEICSACDRFRARLEFGTIGVDDELGDWGRREVYEAQASILRPKATANPIRPNSIPMLASRTSRRRPRGLKSELLRYGR